MDSRFVLNWGMKLFPAVFVIMLSVAAALSAEGVPPAEDRIQCTTKDKDGLTYTGHSWGVAVRDRAGKIASKIRFDNSVLQISLYKGHLFAGGTRGLYCVDLRTGGGRQVALLGETNEPEGNPKQRGAASSHGRICWQAMHGQCLWVPYDGSIQKILLDDGTIQSFNGKDLGIDLYIGGLGWDFGLALDDGFWVQGYGYLCRLPHGKDSSEVLRYAARSILGVEANAIWCEVAHANFGSRPCRIDRKTGEMTTYYFGGGEEADRVNREGSCRLAGRSSSGDFVFSWAEGGNAILRNDLLQNTEAAFQGAPFKTKRFRSTDGTFYETANINSPDALFSAEDDVAELPRERDSVPAKTREKSYEWLELKRLPSSSDQWDADPRMRLAVTGDDAMRLQWIEDVNPHLRSRVIAYLDRVDHVVLGGALNDPFPDVRETALHRLVNDKSVAATALLRAALDNRHPPVRCYATLALLRRGELPATRHLRFAASQVDYLYIDTGRENHGREEVLDFEEKDFWMALAPVADVDAIAVMQEREWFVSLSEGCYKDLGGRLALFPEGISRLTDGEKLQKMEGVFPQGVFARRVAVAAGPAILPIMHQWLGDQNFLRRTFAASVCGQISDKSSLEPLLKALEHDDGLALGAVVEALGRLKLAPALQPLTELSLKVDQEIGNAIALSGAFMPVWVRGNAVREKGGAGERPNVLRGGPKGCVPVSPQGIAEAIDMIGPETVQPFFRELYKHPASVQSSDAVAHCLRPDKEPGHSENIRILCELIKSMWGGTPRHLAFAAAVSLLRFDRLGRGFRDPAPS